MHKLHKFVRKNIGIIQEKKTQICAQKQEPKKRSKKKSWEFELWF